MATCSPMSFAGMAKNATMVAMVRTYAMELMCLTIS